MTVSSKNQVVLPVKISKKWKLSKGMHIGIRERNGRAIIRPIPKLSDLMGIDKGLHLDRDLKKMREEDLRAEKSE